MGSLRVGHDWSDLAAATAWPRVSVVIWGILCGLCCLVARLCPILCGTMDCRPPGSSAHGISQTRILEWMAISSYRESSWPRDRTWVSCVASEFFTNWATRDIIREYYSEVKLLSRVWLFATPWPVAYQASWSMGFSRQEYWSGLPFPSPREYYRESQKQMCEHRGSKGRRGSLHSVNNDFFIF